MGAATNDRLETEHMQRLEATRRSGAAGRPSESLAAFARCMRGATAVEYGLIAAFIALVIVVSVSLTGALVIDLLAGVLDGF